MIAGFPPLDARAWFLAGPTACGKSALSLALAERLGAEILSLDSMAIYGGLDIGTAKPTSEDRARVPHHLLDLVSSAEEFSVAQYITVAHATVGDIQSRGKTALFVGGTPLFLKALLRGLFQGPTADWAFRRECEERAAQGPPGMLHAELSLVDPLAAARLHPNDARRVIRALEVARLTGEPISHWQRQFDARRPASACRVVVLERGAEELRARIDRRVEAMFAQGLVEETRDLLASGVPFGRTARQAVGYREALAHLETGVDLPTTIADVKQATHIFSRKQRTWFRSLEECRMTPIAGEPSAEALADRVIAAVNADFLPGG